MRRERNECPLCEGTDVDQYKPQITEGNAISSTWTGTDRKDTQLQTLVLNLEKHYSIMDSKTPHRTQY